MSHILKRTGLNKLNFEIFSASISKVDQRCRFTIKLSVWTIILLISVSINVLCLFLEWGRKRNLASIRVARLRYSSNSYAYIWIHKVRAMLKSKLAKVFQIKGQALVYTYSLKTIVAVHKFPCLLTTVYAYIVLT